MLKYMSFTILSIIIFSQVPIKSDHFDKECTYSDNDYVCRMLRSEFNSWPTIIQYAGIGDLAKVRAQIAAGANVNVPGPKNITALHEASLEGHAKIVEFLIKNGAHIRSEDFSAAAWQNRPEILRIFEANGFDYAKNKATYEHALESAVGNNCADSAHYLIEKKLININRNWPSDINPQYSDSYLATAVLNHNKPIIADLLKHGADPNGNDKWGNPLIVGSIPYDFSDDIPDIFELFMAYGAKIDAVDDEGNTSLIKAIMNERSITLKSVLKFKPKMDIRNKNGQTAASLVKKSKNKEIRLIFEKAQ